MPRNTSASRNRFRLLSKVQQTLYIGLCALFLSSVVSAQEGRIITFDAPGADTNPGDNNGTYPSGVNAWGAITGSYQDTNNAFHGFLRSPKGTFTTFEAPGADTGPYNGTAPSSINDLHAITGSYMRRTASATGSCGVPMASLGASTLPVSEVTARLL